MSYVLLVLVVLAAYFGLSRWQARFVERGASLAERETTFADLSGGEQHVLELVRDVYGKLIENESFKREGGDVIAAISLDSRESKVKSLEINVTGLAAKQRNDGLTDEALKVGVKI
jgi:hypothetical protein